MARDEHSYFMYHAMGIVCFREVFQQVEGPDGTCQGISGQLLGLRVRSVDSTTTIWAARRNWKVDPPWRVRRIKSMLDWALQAVLRVTV
jgi:hypothetical protein